MKGATRRAAVDALRKELQRIAFDANMADRFGATYPYALRCAARRQEIRAALAELEDGREQLSLFPEDGARAR